MVTLPCGIVGRFWEPHVSLHKRGKYEGQILPLSLMPSIAGNCLIDLKPTNAFYDLKSWLTILAPPMLDVMPGLPTTQDVCDFHM